MLFKTNILSVCIFLFCGVCSAARDVNNVSFRGDSTIFGMKIESSYFADSAFLIETTGARFEYVKGQLKIYQGLDGSNRRLLSTITFDNEPNFLKVESNSDHILFWSKDMNIGIYGDSTLIISSKKAQFLKINGNYEPDYEGQFKNKLLFTDSLGGMEINFPSNCEYWISKSKTNKSDWTINYSLDKGSVIRLLSTIISEVINTKEQPYFAAFIKQRELVRGDHWSYAPLPSKVAVENIKKYGAVWCSQLISQHNPAAWNVLRGNSNAPICLYYVSGNSAQAVTDFVTLDYSYIAQNHPEWFLRADYKGNNHISNWIRWNDSNPKHMDYNRFLVDIGNIEFQQWAAKQFIDRVSGAKEGLKCGYDGLAMDNVGLVAFELYETKRHPKWKYANNALAWKADYFSYIKTIHDAFKPKGYLLVLNHTTDYGSNVDGNDWDILMSISDGLMDEEALMSGGKYVWVGERWSYSIKHHEDIVNSNLLDWWVVTPVPEKNKGDEQFRYIYCSFLLTYKPGKSFFFASRGIGGYANPEVPWYSEYDLPIGKPLSTRYQQGNCWVRDYTNAKIVVNPTNGVERIVVDKNKRWLDWATKRAVTELMLPPKTGRILLPTYKSGL